MGSETVLEPDLQAIDEALYDKYLGWCEATLETPSDMGYQKWLEWNFD